MANAFLGLISQNLGETALAVGALGTAAYGLVDASKALWGGVSNAGFGHILRGLKPYGAAIDLAAGPGWPDMLRAHWLNGRSKDDQKGVAKALIRLGLAVETAEPLARAARVDAAGLIAVAGKIAKGEALGDSDFNVLGRFDAMLEAQLDAAFEQADQQYRSAARGLAAAASVALALVALAAQSGGALTSDQIWLGVFVGVVAVPLAPVAKDLSSALNAAVKAVRGGAA